ncbi:collagen type IV alpha-3-binding [Brachionus plicatilis]|uniref:Collagen type IV alpha-3-binding n=1 Tax=Brachionus plicatilis TaxID=10195 RepID=A0A3M7RVZ3_BRAPC|nr:collagen type IV alpha-3-binding [Brachionus plicatilis]
MSCVKTFGIHHRLMSMSNDTFIVYELLNKHWAAAQRNICFWSHIRNFDSNGISSWIAVNYSTEHEQAPIISPVIRAKINIALIGRTKLENNATKSSCSREDLTCEVTYVAFVNPGGSAPVVILRKLFEKEYANFVSKWIY